MNTKNKKPSITVRKPVAEPVVEVRTIFEGVLPFMYASKSAEYVFGTEAGDGFVTVSIPKDRFDHEPGGVLVKVEATK